MPSLARLADVLVGVAADRALGRQAEADHGEVRRQHAVDVEVVDGRQQLAPGQIACGAEDHQLARLRQERLTYVRFQRARVLEIVGHAVASSKSDRE